MNKPEKVVRYLGNCQECEKDHKVRDGLMVHHGYTVENGSFQNDCCGILRQPYELSCEIVKANLDALHQKIHNTNLALQAFDRGEVKIVHRTISNWNKPDEVVTFTPESLTWEYELRLSRDRVKVELERLKRTAGHLKSRVENWKLLPLREIAEDGLTDEVREGRKARAAEAEAKRQVKRDKKAALDKSRKEKLARRQAVLDEAAVKIRAVVIPTDKIAMGEARGRILNILRELGRKKNASLLSKPSSYDNDASWMWEQDLHCDDILVAVGLATPRKGEYGNGGATVDYKTDLWRAW